VAGTVEAEYFAEYSKVTEFSDVLISLVDVCTDAVVVDFCESEVVVSKVEISVEVTVGADGIVDLDGSVVTIGLVITSDTVIVADEFREISDDDLTASDVSSTINLGM